MKPTERVAFTSGPYRARLSASGRIWTVRRNIRQAEIYALKYWNLGYSVLCPHLNTAFFDGEAPDNTWLAGDLAFIDRLDPATDVIVMMPGWQDSEGALAERRFAEARDIQVIEEQ